MTIKILLVDDHKIIRDGLCSLVNSSEDIDIIGEADTGRAALERLRESQPDVVVTDVNMPDLNGVEATRQILKRYPEIKVLALSMYSDEKFVSSILEAGASGYLLKDCAADELFEAIRVVYEGGVYLSKDITNVVVRDYVGKIQQFEVSSAPELTARESEILQLLAEGKPTREIAEMLFVSAKTVETHRSNIMKKLDLYTIPELTKYAIRRGLTSLDS